MKVLASSTGWALALALAPVWTAPAALAQEAPADGGVPVYSSSHTFGPYNLAADTLSQAPAGGVPMTFPRPVWLIGYSTEIVDTEGVPLPPELHCHTMLQTPPPGAWALFPLDGRPFKGVFSDGYTMRMQLPVGFGLHLEPGEKLDMIPMFNNRESLPKDAAMKVQVDVVMPEDLPRELTPVYSTMLSVNKPHLYQVEPGRDLREREFKFPYSGVIRAMAVHIHPYGRWLELVDAGTGKTIWRAEGIFDDTGRLVEMPVYSNAEGVPFTPEDEFIIRAEYVNDTDEPQDAMAGLFIFFTTEDGTAPEPPSTDSLAAAQGGHDHGG